jgi:hypothetical protein
MKLSHSDLEWPVIGQAQKEIYKTSASLNLKDIRIFFNRAKDVYDKEFEISA